MPAVELGQTAARGAIERAGVAPERHRLRRLRPGDPGRRGPHPVPAGVARRRASPSTSARTPINKVCASGMRAVALADQLIRAGDHELVLAGGMESMSNARTCSRRRRYGYRFGDATLEDAMLEDALRDPWSGQLMYEQAERGRDRARDRRAGSRRLGARSHERAVAAIDGGRFAEEIVPVEIAGRKANASSTSTRGRVATPRSRSSPRCGHSSRSTRRTPPATRRGSTTARRRSSSPTRSGPRSTA